ncbi:MAG: BON domain-containing protein [Dehalococcoidales bacterium]|nr:BON domain-containing protein [Dehalococcoidales bacterium]
MDREDEEGPSTSHVRGSRLDQGLSEGFPTDAELWVNVTDALTWDPAIDHTQIRVSVFNTVVTLAGTVNSEDNKQRAEDIARNLPGVGEVNNQLKVLSC